jgi:hypothetical protein
VRVLQEVGTGLPREAVGHCSTQTQNSLRRHRGEYLLIG